MLLSLIVVTSGPISFFQDLESQLLEVDSKLVGINL